MKVENKDSVELSQDEERMVFAMQLLGDKTRYKLFKLLLADEELCVTEIAEHLDVSASAVSQHFRNFELIGLVDKERTGQKICYLLKDETLAKQLKALVTENANKKEG